MRAALTVWDGRVSPVFDVSREALLLVVEGGALVAQSYASLETSSAALKVERLAELEVDTLVCGAISAPLQRELCVRGVRVIGFVAGDLQEVLAALLAGTLPSPALAMPGCCGGRSRRGGGARGGCGCGRGRMGRS